MAVKIPVEAHEIIRTLVRNLKLTQAQVAKALDVSPKRIQQIVNDYQNVKLPNGRWTSVPRRRGTDDG